MIFERRYMSLHVEQAHALRNVCDAQRRRHFRNVIHCPYARLSADFQRGGAAIVVYDFPFSRRLVSRHGDESAATNDAALVVNVRRFLLHSRLEQ